MSFWKQSPGPHWKEAFTSLFKHGNDLPFIYRTNKVELPISSDPSITIQSCSASQMNEYATFLQTHFKITEKSKCCISAERLQTGLQQGWICAGAFTQNSQLVGTVISRPLGTLFFLNRSRGIKYGTHSFPSTDLIDFFCIAPAYQKKRIGSDLLHFIDAASTQYGRQIHCFTKEISPLWAIPPVYTSHYIYRINSEYVQHHSPPPSLHKNQMAVLAARKTLIDTNTIAFQPTGSDLDTTIYYRDLPTGRVYVAIVDLHHRAKSRDLYGGPLGEILWTWADSEFLSQNEMVDAVESICKLVPYEVILADKNLPHFEGGSWHKDVPYFVYLYNFNPHHFFTVKPWFFF